MFTDLRKYEEHLRIMHRVKVKESIASCFDLCNDGSLEVK